MGKKAAADTRARPVSVSGGRGAGRDAGPRPKSGQGRGGLVAAHVGSAEGEKGLAECSAGPERKRIDLRERKSLFFHFIQKGLNQI